MFDNFYFLTTEYKVYTINLSSQYLTHLDNHNLHHSMSPVPSIAQVPNPIIFPEKELSMFRPKMAPRMQFILNSNLWWYWIWCNRIQRDCSINASINTQKILIWYQEIKINFPYFHNDHRFWFLYTAFPPMSFILCQRNYWTWKLCDLFTK